MNEEHSVDFLRKKYQLAPKRSERKREKRRIKTFVIALLLTACAGLFFSFKAQSPSQAYNNESGLGIFNPFAQIIESIGNGPLSDDRINVLLLGIGGAGHDGPELTDTIILASFKPSTSQVSMISVPRDLMVQIPGYGPRKINAVNAYAEQDKRGSGPAATTAVIEQIFDQKIDYYVKIDFASFEELINAIGGVNIYVDRSFTDSTYPTDNYGYQVLKFEQGWQRMNGETALQYARSRHGNNGEGSDFARATRQQKVITAAKDELLSTSTFLNPARINQLANVISRHVTTNMGIVDMVRLAKFAPDIDSNNIRSFVVNDAPGNALYSSYVNGAYFLLPKKSDWSDLKYLAANIFEEDIDTTIEQKSLQAPTQETTVAVENGTFSIGLAAESAEILQSSGFIVENITNAERRDYAQTTIVDLTEGKKSVELSILEDYFDAAIVQTPQGWLRSPAPIPDVLTDETRIEDYEGVDFLVILGQNSEHLIQ